MRTNRVEDGVDSVKPTLFGDSPGKMGETDSRFTVAHRSVTSPGRNAPRRVPAPRAGQKIPENRPALYSPILLRCINGRATARPYGWGPQQRFTLLSPGKIRAKAQPAFHWSRVGRAVVPPFDPARPLPCAPCCMLCTMSMHRSPTVRCLTGKRTDRAHTFTHPWGGGEAGWPSPSTHA